MIGPFRGEHAYLSNFYAAPVKIWGHSFPTAEHAYQADKADTWEGFEYVANAPTPMKAKKRGGRVSMRPRFEEEKVVVMHAICLEKFTQNQKIHDQLLETGDEELVELNHWGDTFWGQDEETGQGLNALGQILMQIRDTIRTHNRIIAQAERL